MPGRVVMSVPAHPVLNWSALAGGDESFAASMLEGRAAWIVTSGRVALAHALQAWGVGPGDEVLVPAYHCRAMTTPIEWLNARPVFYPLQPDLTADQAAWTGLLTPRTRALLVVHYFGFAFRLDEARAFCDRNGLALIEDCAHAFYTLDGGRPLGRTGDYALGSLMKFLPTFEGGALVSRSDAPAPRIAFAAAGWRYELKASIDVIERAGYAGGLAGVNSLIRLAIGVKHGVRAKDRLAASGSGVAVPAAVQGGFAFEPRWMDVRPSAVSRLILRRAQRRHVAEPRRHVYQTLAERLRRIPGIELPFPILKPGTVPYVFPLLAERGESLFWRARDAGIQLFRWEFTEDQSCPVTRRYARALLQFPCHQTLDQTGIDLIVDIVRDQSAAEASGGRSP